MDFLKKHKENIIEIVSFIFLCFFLYWLNIGNYPFIDTNETKYVSIAKEIMNNNNLMLLKINNENFFENPPFIFWLINLFCFIFGKISNTIVRIPFALITTIGIANIYFSLKKIINRNYAIIVSLIFATSVGIITFSHLAILNILYVMFNIFAFLSLYKAVLNEAPKKRNKEFIIFFVFTALNTLTTGLFGLIVPLITLLTVLLITKEKILNTKILLFGLTLILVINIPWFLIMIKEYNGLFISSFLSEYNLMKSFGIKNIGIVLSLSLIFFFPWIITHLGIFISRLKTIFNSLFSYFGKDKNKNLNQKWQELNTIEKFNALNIIIFLISGLFALLYGKEYTYLIVFLVYPLACFSGNYWFEYINKKSNETIVYYATIIPNLIFIILTIISVFGHDTFKEIKGILLTDLITILFLIPLISIFSAILKGRIQIFIANVLLMVSLTIVLIPDLFCFISDKSGENDLIAFATLANNDKTKLAAFIPSRKHSLTYYYDAKVDFNNQNDIEWLRTYLKENQFAYVITEIKTLWKIEEAKINYILLDSGKRYCLIQYLDEKYIKKEDVEIKKYE